MPNCTHKAWKRDFAAVEGGMCPLCLQAELREAKAEVERLKASRDAVDAENGRLVVEVERLKAELAEARNQRDTAYGYGNDGGTPPWMK